MTDTNNPQAKPAAAQEACSKTEPTTVAAPAGDLSREEAAHLVTIDQREAAEEALGAMFTATTGRVAEWSSAWGYSDAIEEVEEHVAALERKASTPATPGIDLAALREMLDGWKNSDYPLSYEGQCAQKALNACIADVEGLLIDASPKGGSDAREALAIAYRHIDVESMRVSHCNDLAKILAAMQATSAEVGP